MLLNALVCLLGVSVSLLFLEMALPTSLRGPKIFSLTIRGGPRIFSPEKMSICYLRHISIEQSLSVSIEIHLIPILNWLKSIKNTHFITSVEITLV